MINNKLIKMKMIEKDLNIIKVAELLGVSNNTLSKWANGKNLQQIDKFLDLLILLNIDIKEIKKG